MNPIVRNKVLQERGVPARPVPVLPPPAFKQNDAANIRRMNAPAAYRPNPVPVQRIAAPPTYRSQPTASETRMRQLAQAPLRPAPPPVYRPQLPASQPSRSAAISAPARPAPPPVYRPTPVVSQPKRNPAVGVAAVPGAPPIYRPAPPANPVRMERRFAAVQLAMAGAMNRQPGAAPPVYHPNSGPANGNNFQQRPSPPFRPATIQPLIHTAKTHKSRPVRVLKATKWYRDLDDAKKPFAIVLHAEGKSYTKQEAEGEIDTRIARGDPPPSANVTAKALRIARVRQNTKDNPPSDLASRQGAILNKAGMRAYNRHLKKIRKRPHTGSRSRPSKRPSLG
jgi:hypothetical protein